MPIFGVGAAAHDDAVELVGAREGEDRRALVVVEARFLVERLVADADVEAARRHREIVGDLDRRRDRCGRRTVAVDSKLSFTHLMPTQTPAKRDSAKPRRPKSSISCTPAGLSTGIIAVDHRELGLVRRGRAFAGVVVAHQRQHAAVLRRCRRGWRGGTRRRCDRRRGPCRTRCRTRRRTCRRRAARPAACPRARSRRDPR